MRLPLIAALSVAAGAWACAPMPPGPGPLPPADAEQCGADRYQHLVGRHRSEIPQTPAGQTWRVTCTTCPVTMDYSPRRMNIFYDERTGVVREVRCG